MVEDMVGFVKRSRDSLEYFILVYLGERESDFLLFFGNYDFFGFDFF